jgi:hypothetical protein
MRQSSSPGDAASNDDRAGSGDAANQNVTRPSPGASPDTGPAASDSELLAAGLIEEGTKKSGLVWLGSARSEDASAARPPASRPVWHVWADGAMHLVVDGREQPLPDVADGDVVRVVVRSKDTGGRLVTWYGRVTELAAGGDAWQAVVPALHAARLNHTDGERQPERWAAESRVLRVDPVGRLAEVVAAEGLPADTPMPRDAGSAPPPSSPATTVVARARRSRRRRERSR